jgi:hypothetical protein
MEAIKELLLLRERLESQLRILQSEVDAVNKAIKVMEREHPESAIKTKELSSLGVTDAIRRTIKGELITPLQVRDQMILGGFPCPKGKSKLLNIVWATMQRLGESSDYEVGKSDGKFALRRKASPRDASMLPLAESAKAVQ